MKAGGHSSLPGRSVSTSRSCASPQLCPCCPALQAERYVCSVPRDRYSLLGHRAALVLAGDAEAGDYFSSFLKGTEKEEVRSSWAGMADRLLCGQQHCGDTAQVRAACQPRWLLAGTGAALAFFVKGSCPACVSCPCRRSPATAWASSWWPSRAGRSTPSWAATPAMRWAPAAGAGNVGRGGPRPQGPNEC